MKLNEIQKARLLALSVAKNLSEAEKLELNSLRGIADLSGELEEITATAAAMPQTETPAAPVAPEASSTETPAPETPEGGADKPGIGSQVRNIFSGRNDLIAQAGQLRAENGQLRADLTRREGELTAANGEIETLKSQVTKLNESLQAAHGALAQLRLDERSKEETVEGAFASANMPREEVPAPGAEAGGDIPSTKAELEVALKALDTHAEKKALIAKFKAAQKAA